MEQCYVCQSLIKFPTYTFPYVVLFPTIGLVYNLIALFISFLFIEHESKENKTQTKLYYIYLAHDYKDRSLSKHSKRKDQIKLLFN